MADEISEQCTWQCDNAENVYLAMMHAAELVQQAADYHRECCVNDSYRLDGRVYEIQTMADKFIAAHYQKRWPDEMPTP